MKKIISLKKYAVLLALALLPSAAFAAPTSPINSVQDIVDLFNKVLYWVSAIFWIVAGIATLYAGFLYLTAAGNDQQVEKAKKQLLYAIIAIAIGLIGPGMNVLVSNFLGGK